MPEKLRLEVHTLQESIHFVGDGISGRPVEAAKLQLLRRAIVECATVRFLYHTRYSTDGRSPLRHRDADPYNLANHGGIWYLSAYCHIRRGVRNFRLDRMDDLSLLDRRFLRPANFQMQKRDLFEPGSFDVRVLCDAEVTRWVRESPPYYTVAQAETPQGLLLTLHIRHDSEILQWLLSWGRHIRVLEPEALRRRVAEEASAMLANSSETSTAEAHRASFEAVESLLP